MQILVRFPGMERIRFPVPRYFRVFRRDDAGLQAEEGAVNFIGGVRGGPFEGGVPVINSAGVPGAVVQDETAVESFELGMQTGVTDLPARFIEGIPFRFASVGGENR